jgi:hypothetical protein
LIWLSRRKLISEMSSIKPLPLVEERRREDSHTRYELGRGCDYGAACA